MQEINEFIMRNLIYCEETHSFTHRLFEKFKKKMPKNYKEAQQTAWEVVGEMNDEERKCK